MTQIPEVSVWPGLSLLRGALALPEFSCALGAEGWEDAHGEDRGQWLDGGMLLTLQPRGASPGGQSDQVLLFLMDICTHQVPTVGHQSECQELKWSPG